MITVPSLELHPLDNEKKDFGRIGAMLGMLDVTNREWREINRCGLCGVPHWHPDDGCINMAGTPCEHGCCMLNACMACGYWSSSMGPAGCECCHDYCD